MQTFNSFNELAAGTPIQHGTSYTPFGGALVTENAVFKVNGREVQPTDFSGNIRETMESINTLESRYIGFLKRRDAADKQIRDDMSKLTRVLQLRLQDSRGYSDWRTVQDKAKYDVHSQQLSSEKMTVTSEVFGITEKKLF